MSDTVVSVLTPPGSGAIATVEVAGPRAWEIARTHFRPAGGKPLPDSPPAGRFWFGNFGGDEVVLAAKAADRVEVHCHGGRRVVRWVMELCGRTPTVREGVIAGTTPSLTVGVRPTPLELLPFAPTLRTASVLLDQHHGAFDRAVRGILQSLDTNPAEAVEPLRRLASFAPIGRHLVEPWKVVVAGPPNVGKSSLVNALAGYQRSVVSEVAGTTRDAVGVRLAFDGWPVELIDTAGLRESEGLEAEGIAIAESAAAEADLVLWVMDGAEEELVYPDDAFRPKKLFLLANKIDLHRTGWISAVPGVVEVSAATGEGVSLLASQMIAHLVLPAPSPGDAVPITPHLADAVEAAHAALAAGEIDEAKRLLRACLEPRR